MTSETFSTLLSSLTFSTLLSNLLSKQRQAALQIPIDLSTIAREDESLLLNFFFNVVQCRRKTVWFHQPFAKRISTISK